MDEHRWAQTMFNTSLPSFFPSCFCECLQKQKGGSKLYSHADNKHRTIIPFTHIQTNSLSHLSSHTLHKLTSWGFHLHICLWRWPSLPPKTLMHAYQPCRRAYNKAALLPPFETHILKTHNSQLPHCLPCVEVIFRTILTPPFGN